MATNYVYNLAWAPGQTNKEFQASYSVSFATFANWLFFSGNAGTYNLVSLVARSVYINNKNNSDGVTFNASGGVAVRQIPPYSEARFDVSGYSTILLTGAGGRCSVEFSNLPHAEDIFQRTDSSKTISQFSGAVGAIDGDLVTVDRIGRLQPANLLPFAANNTVVDLQPSTAWPANPLAQTFSSNSLTYVDSLGRLVSIDNNGGANNLNLWVSTNAGVNSNADVNPGNNQRSSGMVEGASSYFIYQSGVGGFKLNKNTLVRTALPNGGFTAGLVLPKTSNTNVDYWMLASGPFQNIGVYNVVNDIASGNAFTNNFSLANQWEATYKAYAKLMTSSTAMLIVQDSVRLAYNVVALPGASIPLASFQIATLPNIWRGNNSCDVLFNSASNGFLPVIDSGGVATLLRFTNNGLSVASTSLGYTAAIVCGIVSPSGDFISCGSNGGTIQARVHDIYGSVISTATFVPPSCTNVLDIVPIPVDDVGGSAYLIIYADGAFVRSFLVDGYLVEILSVTSPITIGGNSSGFACYNSAASFASVSVGTQPVTVKKDFAKSAFGVYRGDGAVQMDGYGTINQSFLGTTTFNQNAAAVVGNRGIVINSTVQLQGLLP